MNKPYDKPKFVPQAQWAACVQYAPLVSMDLVVTNPKGMVLLGWRTNRPAQHCWFVPGGVIRKNESLDAAFTRVLNNELGIGLAEGTCKALRTRCFDGVYEHHYPDNFTAEPFTTHYVVLAHRLASDELIGFEKFLDLPTEQHKKYCWLLPHELVSHPDVHENTKAYFQKF